MVTVYRPPGCNTDKFKDVIDKIDNWLEEIEKADKRPSVIITVISIFGI